MLEIQARLAELGARLKQSPERAAGIADWLLAPGFRGAPLRPADETSVSLGSRARDPPRARRARRAHASTRAPVRASCARLVAEFQARHASPSS